MRVDSSIGRVDFRVPDRSAGESMDAFAVLEPDTSIRYKPVPFSIRKTVICRNRSTR
jgi:hypothetical protein